jgi:protein-S-isoprenylcysteine O-methyltransferase Ste14
MREAPDSAHERWWQVSEVVFGLPLLAAIVLQFVAPLSLPGESIRPVIIVIGALLILAGLALVILTRREFAKHGERTDPGNPTHHIMSTGVFSFSRNPMYLGIVIFLAGVALAFDWPWVMVMLMPSIVACHYILIAPEERYLAAKFDDEYAQYARSVQRWAGRK